MFALAILMLSAHAHARNVTTFAILSPSSGLCMEAEGNGNGPWVKQVPCDFNDDAQRWTDQWNGSGLWYRNVASGKCLDSVYGWLSMQDCGPWDDQTWAVITVEGEGAIQTRALREADDGTCIDIPNGTSNTYWLQTHTCHYGWNQRWTIVLPEDNWRTVSW